MATTAQPASKVEAPPKSLFVVHMSRDPSAHAARRLRPTNKHRFTLDDGRRIRRNGGRPQELSIEACIKNVNKLIQGVKESYIWIALDGDGKKEVTVEMLESLKAPGLLERWKAEREAVAKRQNIEGSLKKLHDLAEQKRAEGLAAKKALEVAEKASVESRERAEKEADESVKAASERCESIADELDEIIGEMKTLEREAEEAKKAPPPAPVQPPKMPPPPPKKSEITQKPSSEATTTPATGEGAPSVVGGEQPPPPNSQGEGDQTEEQFSDEDEEIEDVLDELGDENMETADVPSGYTLEQLMKMNREQLNVIATDSHVAEPEKLANKREVAEAILAAGQKE